MRAYTFLAPLCAALVLAGGAMAQERTRGIDLNGGDDPIPFNPTGFEAGMVVKGNSMLGKPVITSDGVMVGTVTGVAREGGEGLRFYVTLNPNVVPNGGKISVKSSMNTKAGDHLVISRGLIASRLDI